MNIRPSILFGAIAVIALSVALSVWHVKRQTKTTTGALAPLETGGTVPNHPAEAVTAPWQREAPQRMESHPAENNAPIIFYGRLEDQSALPVAGAEITGTTIYHTGAAKDTARFVTTSDADGLFKLDAGAGESLELMPRKPGYALASTNNGGFYAHSKPEAERQHPDPDNPVVIKMWKLQGAEPLVSIDRQYRFPNSNAPLLFDFVTQDMVASGGDIRITIVRPPGVISPSNPQDWSVEIEGVQADGGLMETTVEGWRTTYWAPVDGYRTKIALPVSANGPQNWTNKVNGVFFVQTRDGGVYTKLVLSVSINSHPEDPVEVELHGIANTNGSCNWEGDPATFRAN